MTGVKKLKCSLGFPVIDRDLINLNSVVQNAAACNRSDIIEHITKELLIPIPESMRESALQTAKFEAGVRQDDARKNPLFDYKRTIQLLSNMGCKKIPVYERIKTISDNIFGRMLNRLSCWLKQKFSCLSLRQRKIEKRSWSKI